MVILLEEGCLPEQVDKVMVDFGYPMGPFAVGDLAGLDISAAGRRRRAAANPNYRKLPIADRLVELGRFGQKTGAGWYRYEKGDRTPHPDPEVAAIIKQLRPRWACRSTLHRPGDPAPPVVLLGQRGLPDPGGRHRLPRQRHRRDVAARLRLPPLPRRPDVLGRRHGAREVHNQIAAWHQQYGERWAPARLLASWPKPAPRSARRKPRRWPDRGFASQASERPRRPIRRTRRCAKARPPMRHRG